MQNNIYINKIYNMVSRCIIRSPTIYWYVLAIFGYVEKGKFNWCVKWSIMQNSIVLLQVVLLTLEPPVWICKVKDVTDEKWKPNLNLKF